LALAVEWREVTVEDIASHIAMGPFGSDITTDNFVPAGVPVIRGVNLTTGRFRGDEFVYLTDRKADQLANANAFPGDLVLTHRGTLGQVGLVPSTLYDRYVVSQSQMKLTCDPEKADPLFVYYYFRSPAGQHALLMNASQTGVPAISRPVTSLKAVRLALPGLREQRAISHILGTLDDKIELNRRMGETLEAMARALFKSWFVDFDPVRAKADGRDLGLPKPLADLFPARLVQSELGEIPEGWAVKPIGDLAEVVGGSTPKTERAEYWDGGTHHWVTPKDLSGLPMPVLLDTGRKITDAGLAQISSGLLPIGTVLLSSRAPIGYLAITEVPVAVNQGFIAMKPRDSVSNLFLLRWADAAKNEIINQANGSTFLEISKASFRPIRTVAPPAPLMAAFDRASRPLFGRVVGHERESRILASLRDSLLPKLISGELRIAQAN
jgi:type I restriction enzyme S subunit